MKIGLAGVPGSGKTDLANAIKTHLTQDGEAVKIIDDYVENISIESDLALGFDAAYVGNIGVALGRASLERKADLKYKNIITCGTLFETSSYAAQSLEQDYKFLTTEEEKQDFVRRSEATMRIMACFYIDLVRYDYIFHLTPTEISENENITNLEQNLQSAFQAFNLFDHVVLEAKGSSNKEIVNNRLKKVLETINADKSEG